MNECPHGFKVHTTCAFCGLILPEETIAPWNVKTYCKICKRELNTNDPKSLDCGGDCQGCIEEFEPPPAPIIISEGSKEILGIPTSPEQEELEEKAEEPSHNAWDCPPCEGNGYVNDDGTGDCECKCHEVAETEPEPEKTAKEILEEKIASGEVKRVKAQFSPYSTIHKEQCPYCGQVAVEVSREHAENEYIIELECGHTITKNTVKVFTAADYRVLESIDNKRPFEFQAIGAEFLDKANGRALIADEMGLGKTIQALIWLKNHPEAWPFMVVTKASLKVNWFREIVRWLRDPRIQILDASNEVPIPDLGYIGFIVSVDTVGRAEWTKDIEDHDFIKTVILDECQTIKNMNAKRTKGVRNLCQGKEHIIGLSGTPVKNNAAEYFPVLNILRPEKFYGYSPFIYKWVDTYSNGYGVKAGGIKSHMLDEWNRVTGEFIIRRKRLEVLPDLPAILRAFQYHDLGENVRRAYTQAFEDFMESCESNSVDAWSNSLAAMSRMRHLTGIAKVEPCVEYVTDFILNNVATPEAPAKKICIFAHHRDVIGLLNMKIDELLIPNGFQPCSVITGETPAELRQEIIDSFQKDDLKRVMILSTLAAGEGLNLQFVEDMIALERQWNPANEEQAEGRFSRIGARVGSSVSALYLVAIDTIDEFFARLVEQKRSFMASTLDGKEYQWNETSLMKELAEELKTKGRKPWMMQKGKPTIQ